MKTTDMRFDETICREMIGKTFDKYRCDRLDITNSVTQSIRRGQSMAGTLVPETEFLDGWDNSVMPRCIREIIKIM